MNLIRRTRTFLASRLAKAGRWGKLGIGILIFLIVALPPLARADEGAPNEPGAPQRQISSSDTLRGYLWDDVNCDGVRQESEGALPDHPSGGNSMSLFYIGNDGVPFTSDDAEIGVGGPANGLVAFALTDGGGDYTYYLALRPRDRPAGFVPGPYQQGADRALDNDMHIHADGAWATTTFVIPKFTGFGFPNSPPPVTGIDIGLCSLANIPRPYHVALPVVLRE